MIPGFGTPSFRSLTDQDSLQFIDLRDEILYLTQNNSEILYNFDVPTNVRPSFETDSIFPPRCSRAKSLIGAGALGTR